MGEEQFNIFDEQFKNASEHYEPAFNEAAWQKMSAKLDKEQNFRKLLPWYWWLSDAIMISLMLYMAITLNDTHEAITNQPGEQTINAGKNKKAVKVTEEVSIPNPINHDNSRQSSSNSILNDAAGHPHTNRANSLMDGRRKMIAERAGNDQSPSGKLLNNGASDASKTGAAALDKVPLSSYQTGTLNSTSKEINVPANTTNTHEKVDNKILPNAEETAVASLSEPAGTSVADSGNNIGLNTTQGAIAISKKTTGNNHGFYLHAALAPEWSYIKGNDAGPITIAFGGGIGYAFGKNWSVQAGLYSTQKNYAAGPGDYKAKPGTYYYNLTINHVDAKCNILEIPVTVNYRFLQRRRHGIFASVGFASLVMQKEIYNYDYQRLNGAQAYSSRAYKTNNFHPFATTILSAACQLTLNKNLSLNASPYVKIPIYGVGEGSVKIGSTGLMMGLQYQLPTRSTHKH